MTILSQPELARASFEFWLAECSRIAEARQNFLAVGKLAWSIDLDPAHNLALRRCQQARVEWMKHCEEIQKLDPHPGFWDSRPDIT